MKTKPKIGQIYKCRDERHGKRWVRIERFVASVRRKLPLGSMTIYAKAARVSVRRGNSRKWIQSQRTIKIGAFNDKRHQDYKLYKDV